MAYDSDTFSDAEPNANVAAMRSEDKASDGGEVATLPKAMLGAEEQLKPGDVLTLRIVSIHPDSVVVQRDYNEQEEENEENEQEPSDEEAAEPPESESTEAPAPADDEMSGLMS